MIRDLAIAFFAALGTGVLATAVVLAVSVFHAGPEFPPPGPVQRDQ